ncbi:hypothetical protein GCK32_021569, partial [Trichostrongylus colubriformis]
VLQVVYCSEDSLNEVPCLRTFCRKIYENVKHLRHGMEAEEFCQVNDLC